MRHLTQLLRLSLLLALAVFLNSCLYTTHHFNSGKVLKPGKTRIITGVGYHTYNESTITKFSLNYRVGVLKKLGPFPGADLGWHLEIPTNPGTMEFDFKLAMPNLESLRFNHSLNLGWGIGMWADNTFFGEYAASARLLGKHLFFINLRSTYLATQFFKVFDEDIDQPLTHKQRWIYQSSLGLYFQIPELFIVPDYIIPQFITTYPQVPAGLDRDDVIWDLQYNVNLGIGWHF
jgi:hypothetical protein